MAEIVDSGDQLSVSQWLLILFVALVVFDVAKYTYNKGSLNGSSYFRSGLFGTYAIVDMILHPVPFWSRQLSYNRNGASTNAMMGTFMMYVTNSSMCKRIFKDVDNFILYAHPNAHWLFGKENLIYMDPGIHKSFKFLLFAGVYGKEALSTYLGYQIAKCRQHLRALAVGESAEVGRGRIHDGIGWTNIEAGEFEARLAFRLMNADASQESFVGPYIDAATKVKLTDDILTFTLGFLCFPCPLPFTGLGKAIAARNRIIAILEDIAKKSKEFVVAGGQPRCVMDYWAKEISENPRGFEVSDHDMAATVLDFLFASQDATTSAVVWALDILTDRPEEVSKLRDELKEKGKGKDSLEDYFYDCEYLLQTAYEVLRYRPPVPMVPHIAKKTVQISEGVVCPKGAMVIPSIRSAADNEEGSDVYSPGGAYSDPNFSRVLTFGAGQHMCPGRKYAHQVVAVFIAVLVTEYDFSRRLTQKSRNTVFYPTLFPEDNLYKVHERAAIL
eukprot:m.105917 g.105917  ORF g.105917 m.105917 type:complete len:500 (-) comp16882_c0_seq1:75-1574(-)